MSILGSLLGSRKGKSDEPMKPVVDPATIVEPVDFFGPDFPYEQGFKEIDAYIRTLPEKGYVPVSDILRLKFYSLYKQATLGDIDEKTVKQPSMFRDWEGYWKVVGWRKCKGMPREQARDSYIELFDAQIRKHSKVKWGAPQAEDRWAAFYDGVRRIQNLPKNGYHLSDELRARVYAMYKQATVGDLKAFQKSEAAKAPKYKWLRTRPAKPGFDQYRYDEWLALEGMTSEYAKRLYCKKVFHEAALYGYVWDPPGTEGHLEVIGDQTSAKTFKRIDSETLKKRLCVENLPDHPEALLQEIEGTDVKLSEVEKIALKKLLYEQEEIDSKASDPCKQPTKVVAAEALEIYIQEKVEETGSNVSERHADPNATAEAPTATLPATTSAKGLEKSESAVLGEDENGRSSSTEEAKPTKKPEKQAEAVSTNAATASTKSSAAAKDPAAKKTAVTAERPKASSPKTGLCTKKKDSAAKSAPKVKK